MKKDSMIEILYLAECKKGGIYFSDESEIERAMGKKLYGEAEAAINEQIGHAEREGFIAGFKAAMRLMREMNL